MKKQRKQTAGGWKRFLAGLLTGVTLSTQVLPGMGITAFADTELDSTAVPLTASSNLTQTWKYSSDYSSTGSGGPSWRFELAGRRAGQDGTYTTGNMSITYQWFGFPTYLFMAADANTSTNEITPVLNGAEGAYNPATQFTLGSGNYYAAKHGQHNSTGGAAGTGASDYYNGYTELLKFGTGANETRIEMRITTSPSLDGKYMFVDYDLVHIGGALPTEGRTFWLGSAFDLQIESSLNKNMYKTSKGFYMQESSHPEVLVDVITDDPTIGIADPVTTKWAGPYSARCINMFQNSAADSALNSDCSISYSWKFKIRPYESIHRRVAFAMKEAAYYVSSAYGNDSNTGMFNAPLKTLAAAIAKCNGKNAYIFIQDYAPIGTAANPAVNFSAITNANTNITISSTDMTIGGAPTPGVYVPLTRDASFTGSLFTNTSNFNLLFTDIILDGQNVAVAGPLISSSTGTLQVLNKVTLKNNKGIAVEASGNTNLILNGGEQEVLIRDNTPAAGQNAVQFGGSGNLQVQNKITVKDNADTTGKPSNVYLPAGKTITVAADLTGSTIGVTTQDLPATTVAGNVINSTQERVIAKATAAIEANMSTCTFSDYFLSDDKDIKKTDVYIGSNIPAHAGSTEPPLAAAPAADNRKYAVLRQGESNLNFIWQEVDDDGNYVGSVSGAPAMQTPGVGSVINLAKPAPAGYALDSVEISQGSYNTLSWESSTGSPNFGKVTGTMPPLDDVTITYKFKKLMATFHFETYGGMPVPSDITGVTGSTVQASMPTPVKYGYNFNGWSSGATLASGGISVADLPALFPQGTVTYHANYVPNPAQKSPFTVVHSSAGGYEFDSTTTPVGGGYSVETIVTGNPITIPGYAWNAADSWFSPQTYYFNMTADPTGSFTEDIFTGTPPYTSINYFKGKMPGQELSANFVYEPDTSTNFQLKVEYVSINGTDLGGTVSPLHAEDPIYINPGTINGYSLVNASVTQGQNAGLAGSYILAVDQTAPNGFDAGYNFTSTMPNQNVTITYLYESNGTQYDMTSFYKDGDTSDPELEAIELTTELKNPFETVAALGRSFYGYVYSNATANPAGGTFTPPADDYSGIMPDQPLKLTWLYHRNPSDWVTLTYKSEANGFLSNGAGVSTDVLPAAVSGQYKASVLKNNASDQGYTFAQIEQKKLMPKAQAYDSYYCFEGWYIDANGNGSKDAGEPYLTGGERFTADTTLTAAFGEDPDKWIDIYFAPGAHVNFAPAYDPANKPSLHIQYDKFWMDAESILPMAISYYTNIYLVDGWYYGTTAATKMEAATPLQNGRTYTFKVKENPTVFGTAVAAPDVSAGLDGDGKGQLTIYHTKSGYKYIVSDLDGNVAAVKSGTGSGGPVRIEDLYPGTRYYVYESTISAVVGAPAPAVDNVTVSDYTEALTPVVVTNYHILPDSTNESQVVFQIKPADIRADYAVLDPLNGNGVVITPETGADGWQAAESTSPPSLSFSGLNPEQEYVVVAVPHGTAGITPQSKLNDGSWILTIPQNELEVPNYIIQTLNGLVKTVNGTAVEEDHYDEAKKGNPVKVEADPTNSAGKNFTKWRILIGSVAGLGNLNSRTLNFTMPATNLVFAAYYERTVDPDHPNAIVEDEVRGGNPGETALDPDDIEDLEDALTTTDDEDLIKDGQDVTYKVIYTRTAVKATESNAIKASGLYETNHVQAYKAPWGMNVTIERYVNGRKVPVSYIPPAGLGSFTTYVQLASADVDMLDYQLYRIDGAGPVLVPLTPDPETTGGLFTFEAEAGARYVLVYNRAYKLTFVNDTLSRHPDEGGTLQGLAGTAPRFSYSFKVRKGEAPEGAYAGYYAGDYAFVPAPGGSGDPQLPAAWTGTRQAVISGQNVVLSVDYTYEGYSYKDSNIAGNINAYTAYDPTRPISKHTVVYAYYTNDAAQTGNISQELGDLLDDALKIADDHFLKQAESDELKDLIEEIIEAIRNPNEGLTPSDPGYDAAWQPPSASDLQDLLDQLRDLVEKDEDKLKDRYANYGKQQETGSKGGSSGGGGGKGSGVKTNPYVGEDSKTYTVGNNGRWEKAAEDSSRWVFVLNGGIRLTNRWAKVEEEDKKKCRWYHFDEHGYVQTGWILDQNVWYHLNTLLTGRCGEMDTAWYYDTDDGRWYYLEPENGAMITGWRNLGGKWYYFAPASGAENYRYNPATGLWEYQNTGNRPLGALYINDITPDGYRTGADGAWIE